MLQEESWEGRNLIHITQLYRAAFVITTPKLGWGVQWGSSPPCLPVSPQPLPLTRRFQSLLGLSLNM